MRDEPTVRLNAGDAAADDESSGSAGDTTRYLPTVTRRTDDGSAGAEPTDQDPTADPDNDAADDGHAPGPGLVIPAGDGPERDADVSRADVDSPTRAVPATTRSDDEQATRAAGGPERTARVAPAAAEQETRALPVRYPATAGAGDRRRGRPAPGGTRSPEARPVTPTSAPSSGRPAPTGNDRPAASAQNAPAGQTPPPPTQRPAPASAGARPSAPPRTAGPRPTGPARPVSPAPVASRPSAARPSSAGPASGGNGRRAAAGRLRRRAGGIVGGLVLGLVAIVAASWTLLVPPDGQDARTPDQPLAAPAQPAAPAIPWARTNGDEFDGPALDRNRWNVYNSPGGFGNGLRRPSAVAQDGGLLTITARPRLNGGTSGGISMGKGQLYGRWEFRARADPGVGYSPAVLLWPDSERFPIDGELDMLESPNGNRSTASAYVHYGADNKTRGAQVSSDFTQWHTFAFEWLPDRLTWYVDGQKAWELTDKKVIPTKPMHLCIQLDQGPAPKFMPGPDASTPDEVRMQVDWARQYRVG